MARLDLLVMGQAPRPEVTAVFDAVLGPGALVQHGCLDGLDRAAIAALSPAEGEEALFTRLPDGTGVSLSKAAVVARGAARLDALAAAGTGPVIVLCTGDFPAWQRPRVLFPSHLLRHLVPALLPEGRLGVLTPLPSQVSESEARWAAPGRTVVVGALSPNADAAEAAEAGADLAHRGVDLVVLDCVSYTRDTKRAVLARAGCPGLLAITAVARVAAELLDDGSA